MTTYWAIRWNRSGSTLRIEILSNANLRWANLSGADLSGADLRWANLGGANLTRADLTGADLYGADLRWANLGGANLSEANLGGANLGRADLSGANLGGANLSGSCLDDNLRRLQRQFCRQCRPLSSGGRIVYRTAISRHLSAQEYLPGRTYIAPVLSADIVTGCHPGIYAASLEWMWENYPNEKLIRCYVRDGDWFITAKGAVRCKRIRVLNIVD